MEHKTFLGLSFIVLISLVLSSFAFAASYDFIKSDSITCGNNLCELMHTEFDIGEEKQLSIAGETYTIKVISIIEEGSEAYTVILNMNGEEVTVDVEGEETSSWNIREKFGFNIDMSPITKDNLVLSVYESYMDDCAVPDCDTRVEIDVHKKWNMIPIYFLLNPGQNDLKGTCKLRDFLVIYGYNPVENEYDRHHIYGKSLNDLKNSLASVGENGLLGGIVVNTGWNSVWVYSTSECGLTAEIRGKEVDLLSRIAEVKAEGMDVNFAPGWNFWSASRDMEGTSFDDIKGDCTIEKAYTFEPQSQSWAELESPPGLSTNFVFKVENKCMFEEPVPAEPELPGAPGLPE